MHIFSLLGYFQTGIGFDARHYFLHGINQNDAQVVIHNGAPGSQRSYRSVNRFASRNDLINS